MLRVIGLWVLLCAGVVEAQPGRFVQGPERPALGLVRHADGWYVLLGDANRAPPTLSLAPISPAGVGQPMASVQLEGGHWPIAVVASAERDRAPWIVTRAGGNGDDAMRVRAVRADGSAPPVDVVGVPMTPARVEVLDAAWRTGPMPLGVLALRGSTLGPTPRARIPDAFEGTWNMPERPTRESWLAYVFGNRTQRADRFSSRRPIPAEHREQRAGVALGEREAVSVVWSRLGDRGTLRIRRIDRSARVRQRVEDGAPGYRVGFVTGVALDATGNVTIGALVSPLQPLGSVERAVVITLAPRARVPVIRELAREVGEWTGPVELIECAGVVWAVRTQLPRDGIERAIAERADGTGTPIVLATRNAADYTPGRGGPYPSRAMQIAHLACDENAREAAAVILYPRRPDDPRPEIALTTWPATPTTGE